MFVYRIAEPIWKASEKLKVVTNGPLFKNFDDISMGHGNTTSEKDQRKFVLLLPVLLTLNDSYDLNFIRIARKVQLKLKKRKGI